MDKNKAGSIDPCNYVKMEMRGDSAILATLAR
jgi:hypothetical protein